VGSGKGRTQSINSLGGEASPIVSGQLGYVFENKSERGGDGEWDIYLFVTKEIKELRWGNLTFT